MRLFLFALVLLSVGLLSGCGERLHEYVSEDGRFRVLLPGEPQTDSDPALPKGIKKVTLLERSGKYEVAWQDLELTKKLSDDARLDAACDTAVEAVKGKALERKEIWLADKYPGRELILEMPGGDWIVDDRMYLVGGRLYHVLASGPKWWVESAQLRKVLCSFALVED